MKKAMIIAAGILAVIALCVGIWFIGYHCRKSNDNLPALSMVAEMSEKDANELVAGYLKTQLRYIWDEPDESSANMDVWTSENATVIVGYNDKGKAKVCGIFARERSVEEDNAEYSAEAT